MEKIIRVIKESYLHTSFIIVNIISKRRRKKKNTKKPKAFSDLGTDRHVESHPIPSFSPVHIQQSDSIQHNYLDCSSVPITEKQKPTCTYACMYSSFF